MRQVLRDYQRDGLSRVLGAYKRGARKVLCVSPTGSGKTTLFSHLAHEVPSGVLILVHRRELATQACNRLREFGVDFGLVMAGEHPKPYARVQVASVQTLVRREARPRARLVIIDEAHLSTAETYATILECYPDALILGVTATPWRLGGRPLAGLYDEVVVVAEPATLREQGHLSPYVGFSYKAPDLSGVDTVGDDYNQAQAGAAMSAIVPNVVEQWKATASHLSTVVFAVTVEHSQKLTAEFRAAGVRAEHLDGTTPLEQRKAILARVDRGETRVLCNVGVAVEGLDIPRLKCCVLARPTMSLARAIQMMGRVRRPWEGVTARIHDHAFVIAKHGLPDDARDYSLDARKEKPPSLTRCEECFALYRGPVCTACAHSNESIPRGERTLQEVHDAELFEFASGGAATAATPPPAPVQETITRNVAVSWDASRRDQPIEGLYTQRVVTNTSYGERPIFIVERQRGRTLTRYELPGTAQLVKKFAAVPVGSRVRVVFTGEQLIAGGKSLKTFSVGVHDGQQ